MLILLGIVFFGALVRLVYLDRVPIGISDDELDYVLTAKSIFYTGKTLDGEFSPYSFKSVPPSAQLPYARAPYMLLSPFIGMLPSSLEFSKFPYAIVSVLTLIVLYLIVRRLWGTRIGLFVVFVSAFNPWSIYFGRTAFDTPLSVFFAYVFICCLLYFHNWYLLLSVIPWLFGLFSYQGMIIIYPFILIISTIGIWRLRNRLYFLPYLLVLTTGVILFLSFILSFKNDRAGTRMNELSTPNSPQVISKVDADRRNAVQTIYNPLFINKFTESAQNIVGNYINAFSTEHLFVSGEGRSTFSLWTHGLFYPFEILLLIYGIYTAFRLHRGKTFWLLSLLMVSPIPSAISNVGASYALRSSFMYPIVSIFIGIGLAYFFGKKRSYYVKAGIILLYVFAILNFLHIYFIRNPVNNSEGFGFSNRVLSKYLALADTSGIPVTYIGNNVVNVYRQYIFYNNLFDRKTAGAVQASIRSHTYERNKIKFVECRSNTVEPIAVGIVITPPDQTCTSLLSVKNNSQPLVISQLSDSGRVYEIYNDTICSRYNLSEYQKPISFSDLLVEKMTTEQFCTTYISKPR